MLSVANICGAKGSASGSGSGNAEFCKIVSTPNGTDALLGFSTYDNSGTPYILTVDTGQTNFAGQSANDMTVTDDVTNITVTVEE